MKIEIERVAVVGQGGAGITGALLAPEGAGAVPRASMRALFVLRSGDGQLVRLELDAGEVTELGVQAMGLGALLSDPPPIVRRAPRAPVILNGGRG